MKAASTAEITRTPQGPSGASRPQSHVVYCVKIALIVCKAKISVYAKESGTAQQVKNGFCDDVTC
jgi:hypothetical protein